MSLGVNIDIETVVESTARLRQIVSEIDEITAYAAETDPDTWAWGVQGVVFSHGYNVSADRTRDILGMLRPAFDGILDRILSSCADHAATDDEISQMLEGLGEPLDPGVLDQSPPPDRPVEPLGLGTPTEPTEIGGADD